jgi:hypothetical protein
MKRTPDAAILGKIGVLAKGNVEPKKSQLGRWGGHFRQICCQGLDATILCH